MNAVDRDGHRAFLNRYYRWSRPIYDLTRKYYLFGRDRVLRELAGESWHGLVEIGPGTGRNLEVLARLRPEALLGGVEACDEMLLACRKRLPQARLVQGFAEEAPYADLLGAPPHRVLFSYSLSMMQDPEAALRAARRQVDPSGEVVVVDFGDLAGLPDRVAAALRAWLRTFHVEPPSEAWLSARGARVTWGPGRYFVIARFGRMPD